MKKPAATEHPVHPLIAARWSPRAFGPEAIDDATLAALFEAARWAPSCFNEQPWIYGWARRGTRDFDALLSALVPFNRGWARGAAVLIFGVARTSYRRNGKVNDWARYDLGQATMSLVLQATSLGLSVHQMAGFDAERAREVLGLSDGEEPVVGIALGRATDELSGLDPELAEKELAPRSRQPQDDFVFEGRVRPGGER